MSASDRQKSYWYNIEPSLGATRRDFDPGVPVDQNNLVSTLHLEVDSIPGDPEVWVGVMMGFPGATRSGGLQVGLDPLDLSEATHLDVWVNDFKPDPSDRGGMLNIDMGFIDENFYRPSENKWEREDRNLDGFTALTEDTGLDGFFDGEPEDDPDDNYDPQRIDGRFTKINGTEGNFLEDSEDLNRNRTLDRLNAYFAYEIDLASPALRDIRRDYPEFTDFQHPDDSWRLYRIRLSDYRVVMPSDRIPYRDEIRYIRIWFDNIEQVINSDLKLIQIAGFELVTGRLTGR